LPNRYGLAIRAATAGDADGISALLQAAGLTADRRGLAARLESIPVEAGLVLLAEDWGPPCGALALRWSWTLVDALKVAEVSTLLVDPEQRRKGIARLLLKAAARAARSAGCGELRILAPEVAEGLGPFCVATGFGRIGESFARSLRKRGSADL
jgi:GNAT superfamily N-acetyltransferase